MKKGRTGVLGVAKVFERDTLTAAVEEINEELRKIRYGRWEEDTRKRMQAETKRRKTHPEPLVHDVDLPLAKRSHLSRAVGQWRNKQAFDGSEDVLPETADDELPSCTREERSGQVGGRRRPVEMNDEGTYRLA